MTIQHRRKNGNVETAEVKLGDTMRSFQQIAEQKRTELEGLLEELKNVDAEIAKARKDIVETENRDVNNAKKELKTQLDKLIKEAGAVKGQTLADVKKARQDDQAAKSEMQRKMDEFMALL